MTRQRIYCAVLCLYLVAMPVISLRWWKSLNAPARPAPTRTAHAASTTRQSLDPVLGLTTIQLPSRIMDRDVPVAILLPPSYDSSTDRHPVLYFLHGYGGDHLSWVRSRLKDLAAEKSWILVFPNGGTGFFINSKQGRYEDFFITELVPYIDQTYRTTATQAGRAIAGISMGGYGAWRLALASPQTFSSACSMSGVIGWGEPQMWSAPFAPGNARGLYGDTYERDYPAGRLLPLMQACQNSGQWTGPALYAMIGESDFLIDSSRTMHRLLQESSVPHEYNEFPGQHTGEFWIDHMPEMIAFHARHFTRTEPPDNPSRHP